MQGRKSCPTCNGSGQVTFFQGVSRFLLTWEECPECAGLGYLVSDDGNMADKTGAEGDGDGKAEHSS